MTGLIDCPECGGEGWYPRIVKYAADGDPILTREECPVCHGEGNIEIEMITCPWCEGTGRVETITDDLSWSVGDCPVCGGEGKVTQEEYEVIKP